MANVINDDALLRFLKPDQTKFYIEQIYDYATNLEITPDIAIEVRKIGQLRLDDGSQKPMEESVPCLLTSQLAAEFDPSGWPVELGAWVAARAERAAPAGVGTFLAPAILNDRRATDNSVQALMTVCVDLDTGDTRGKLAALTRHLAVKPTFIVRSGGITAEGQPKLHVHYKLKEPAQEPWKVAYIREQLALQVQGDPSFKRIPQVIRIPGSLYDKGQKWATVEIEEHNATEILLEEMQEILGIDWNNLAPESMWARSEKTKAERDERAKKVALEQISAGGTGDTRFQRFSEYAGHQIRQARMGKMSTAEALEDVMLWNDNKMVPPWPTQRADAEFHALLQRDKNVHAEAWGELDKPKMQLPNMGDVAPVAAAAAAPGFMGAGAMQAPPPKPILDDFDIGRFAVGKLYVGTAPPERYLVDNCILHSSAHSLVADGGVGKTYLGLELALRMAAGPELPENSWLGFRVLEQAVTIVFTVEDGKDDIHRRLVSIDGDGSLRRAAGDWCFIVPVKDYVMGGLTLVEKDSRGNMTSSKIWAEMVGKIEDILSRCPPGLPVMVVIDTYSATHHGDENSSLGVNEWFRAASLLMKFNASLLVMHHVRKSDPQQEIKSPSDFRNAVRGSNAFVQACRMNFGVWEMPNSDSVLKELPTEQEARLFNMAIIKKNCGADWSDRSDPRYPEPMITLRRIGTGQLVYDGLIHEKRIELTTGKKERYEKSFQQLRAAIVYACRWYADAAWGLTERLLIKDRDKYFPAPLDDMAPKDYRKAITGLVKAGVLREVKVKARGGTFVILDGPTGPYTLGQQIDRAKEMPVLEWGKIRYDEHHGDYIELNPDQTPIQPVTEAH